MTLVVVCEGTDSFGPEKVGHRIILSNAQIYCSTEHLGRSSGSLMEALPNDQYCPHQDLTFKLFGNLGEDYFKGNPKSLNFYFLVIWWGNIFKNLKV